MSANVEGEFKLHEQVNEVLTKYMYIVFQNMSINARTDATLTR